MEIHKRRIQNELPPRPLGDQDIRKILGEALGPFEQLVLNEDLQGHTRRTDPDTSHQAEERANFGSKTKWQAVLCLIGIRRWPGRTAVEMAKYLEKQYPRIVGTFGGQETGKFTQRNYYKLERLGLIRCVGRRKCEYGKGRARTWALAEQKQLEMKW